MPGIKIEVDTATAEIALKRLKKDFQNMGLSAEDAEKESKKLESRLNKKLGADQSTKAMNNLQKTLGLTDRQMANMNRRLGTSKINLDAFKNSTIKTASNVAKMGVALGGLALAGAAAGIVKLGADFEQTMDTVQGVSGASGQSLEDLTNIAKRMGETTEFSATQAAEGLKFLSMAGFNAEQSIKALPGVLNLATVGQLDLGTAADIASNALTAMGLDVSELSRVNDVFATTTTSSNTNIQMMAESFKYAAPSANAFGYSVEGLSAMIGTLGSAGIQGSMAGTQLAFAFKNVDKVFKQLGKDGSGKDLSDTIVEIDKAGWGAQETLKAFGERGGRAVLALLQDYRKAKKDGIDPLYNTLLEKNEKAQGATEKLANIMRDNLIGDLKTLRSTLESVGLDIFTGEQEDLRDVIQETTNYIRNNREEIIAFGGSLGDALQSLLPLAKGVVDFLQNTLEGWNRLPDTIQQIGLVGALIGGAKGKAALLVLVEATGLIEKSFKIAEEEGKKAAEIRNNEILQLYRIIDNYEQEIKLQDKKIKDLGKLSSAEEKHFAILFNNNKIRLKQLQDTAKKDLDIAEKNAIKKFNIEQKGLKNFEKIQNNIVKASKDAQKDITKNIEDSAIENFEITKKEFDNIIDEFDRMDGRYNDITSSMLDANIKMYSNMSIYNDEYYNSVLKKLELEEQALVDQGVSKVNAHLWYLSEFKKIDDEKSKHIEENIEKDILESGTFIDGMLLGLRGISKETENVFGPKGGRKFIKDFVSDVESAFSSSISGGLYSFLDGDFDALDAWKSFWDSITQSVTKAVGDIVAQMLVLKAMNLLSNVFGLDTETVLHTGTLSADEGLAILQGGEMVIPESIASDLIQGNFTSFGDWLNQEKTKQTKAPLISMVATESNGFANLQGIDLSNIGNLNDNIDSSLSQIFSSDEANLGEGLSAAGMGLSGIDNEYASSMLSGMAESYRNRLAAGLVKAITYAQAGVRVEPQDFGELLTSPTMHINALTAGLGAMYSTALDKNLGLTSNFANAGEFIGKNLAGILSGFNPAAMAIGQIIGGLSLDLLGDFFNARDSEAQRDIYEGIFGDLGGRKVFSQVGTFSFGGIGGDQSLSDVVGGQWDTRMSKIDDYMSPEDYANFDTKENLQDFSNFVSDITNEFGSKNDNTFANPNWDIGSTHNEQSIGPSSFSDWSGQSFDSSDWNGQSFDSSDWDGQSFDSGGGSNWSGQNSDAGGGSNTHTSSVGGHGGTTSSSFGRRILIVNDDENNGPSMRNGGWIGENVVGKGLSSGMSYQFHPNEWILPDDKLQGLDSKNNINVYVYLDGEEITANMVQKLNYDTDLIEGIRKAANYE